MSIFVFMLYLAFCESYPGSHKFQYTSTTAAENLCSEYKSYFQSLNDAMNNNFVHCSGSTANDQCTVPAVEILKPCMQGTTLDQECHKNAYSSLKSEEKQCFCQGLETVYSMAMSLGKLICLSNELNMGRQGKKVSYKKNEAGAMASGFSGVSEPAMEELTLEFQVKGYKDAHILLSPCDGCGKGYEIVIGGWENTQSVIREDVRYPWPGYAVTETKGILDGTKYQKFWITVKIQHLDWATVFSIHVGEGTKTPFSAPFMQHSWGSDCYNTIRYIAFAAGPDTTHQWKFGSGWGQKMTTSHYNYQYMYIGDMLSMGTCLS